MVEKEKGIDLSDDLRKCYWVGFKNIWICISVWSVIIVIELPCHKYMSRFNVSLIEHAFFCNLLLLTPDFYSKSEIFDALFTFIAVHLLYQFLIFIIFFETLTLHHKHTFKEKTIDLIKQIFLDDVWIWWIISLHTFLLKKSSVINICVKYVSNCSVKDGKCNQALPDFWLLLLLTYISLFYDSTMVSQEHFEPRDV